MRLATLRDGTRDGTLMVVHPDGMSYAPAAESRLTMQRLLDGWEDMAPEVEARSRALLAGELPSSPIAYEQLLAPLPRAYEWVDGSAYIQHIILVRRARKAPLPETLETEPLVYQGGSSVLLAPRQDIPLVDEAWGLDFEAELCVVLDDTPRGTKAESASAHIKLLMLANDITLRNLIPEELSKGFGFFVSKPATAFAPFAVTPNELGESFVDGRVHCKVHVALNGERVGDPDAGPEMHFSFFDLVAHICQTRSFGAGTIVGSGTVSNADPARGVSCLAERRMREIIDSGEARTPFLRSGDRVRIEVEDAAGRSVFGTIDQRVVEASR